VHRLAYVYLAAYLTLLLLGYGLLGWLLAAFQVSWPIWLGSLGVTLHLIYAGTAAIALSASWVVIIMFLAAARKSWAAVWGSQVPYEQAQLWAEGLLLIWIGITGLILLLAVADAVLAQVGCKGRVKHYSLTSSLWSAMAGGAIYYQISDH
jgi:Mg2+/Co2+ transporter CorB